MLRPSRCYKLIVCAIGLVGAGSLTGAADLNGGIWRIDHGAHQLRPVNGGQVPFLPEARRTYDEHIAQRSKGDLSFDTMEKCKPPGIPRLLLQARPFEFLQRSERIFIVYEWNRLVRVIDMDVPQPESFGPTYLGQSVGHWQGNALVVDSQSFNDTTLLDDAGMPHSDQLHVIERYTLAASGRRLTARIRLEDPKIFSRAWETELTFKRDLNGRLDEDICVQRQKITFWKEPQS